MGKVSYVILGTGGTIWDANKWIKHCFRETFDALNKRHSIVRLPTEAELEAFCGPGLVPNLESIIGKNKPEIVEEGRTLYRGIHDADEGLRAVKLFDGIEAALREMRADGQKLFIATEKATEAAVASLKYLGIYDLFTAVQGTEIKGDKATKAEIIARLIDRQKRENNLLMTPENTLMVDGLASGVAGAMAHGIMTVGAAWGSRADELEAAGAAWMAYNADGLPIFTARSFFPTPVLEGYRVQMLHL